MTPVARLFEMHRATDSSGISGTGIVAHGIQFPDGTIAMRWSGVVASTVIYGSIADVEYVHGHHGDTQIVWT